MPCKQCEKSTQSFKHLCCENACSRFLDLHLWCFDYRDCFDIIQKCKYRQETSHYRHLIQIARAELRDALSALRIDLIVPIPSQTSHIKSRGIDHTLYLANEISKLSRIPNSNLLLPARPFSQVRSDRQTRLTAPSYLIASSFRARSILLVDDVASTRSTFNAASKSLKHGGAHQVYGFSLAYNKKSFS